MQIHINRLYVQVCIFLLLLNVTAGKVIDDFSHTTNNHFGQARSGGKVDEIRHGLFMHHSTHFLFEPLDPDLDMTEMSLKINYTANTAGERTLIYMQQNPFSIHQPIIFKASVLFEEADQQFISIPLHLHFPYTNLRKGFAFKIGGPLWVHGLELEPIAKASATVPTSPWPDLLESSLSVKIPNPHPLISYNLNTLGMKREGSGITPLTDGIMIADGGYLNEYVGTQLLDFTARQHIQITYSSRVKSAMHIQIQFHYLDSVKYTQIFTLSLHVSSGNEEVVNWPIAEFPTPQAVPNDVSVCILGPITIHHIKLIDWYHQTGLLNPLLRKRAQRLLVDELSNWPLENYVTENLHLPVIFPHYSQYMSIVKDPQTVRPKSQFTITYSDIAEFRIHRNNLNLLGGVKISNSVCNRNGILIRRGGYIFEQIAKHGNYIDLKGGSIEIGYSSKYYATLQLEFTYWPDTQNSDGSRDSLFSNRYFRLKKGTNKIARYVFKYSTPTFGFSVKEVEMYPLVIHQIRLSFPVPGTRNQIRNIVLQDYRNPSPLIFDIDKINPPLQQNWIQGPLLIDYGQNLHYPAPSYSNSNLLPGIGIEIMKGGWLNQDMHYRQGKHVKIQYSARVSGTRKVMVTYRIDLDQVKLDHHDSFFICNVGNYLDVYIPLLDTPKSTVHIISIQISGPLLVHQFGLLDTVPVITFLPPGHSLPDALLMDDFSNWTNVSTNILDYTRHVHGGNFGLGYVTLHNHNQHLIEHFRNKSSALTDVNNLSFRITYSVDHVVNCYTLLYFDDSALQSTRPTGIDVIFVPGSKMTLNIPINDLEVELPTYPHLYHGVKINGPRGSESPLIIHRIEIISSIAPYNKPICYELELDSSRTIDYKSKLKFLRDWRSQTREKLEDSYQLNVDRMDIWSATNHLLKNDPEDLRRKFDVKFNGEDSIDEGGPSREFFTLMAKEIKRKDRFMFISYELEIDPRSGSNLNTNLQYYRAIGRIIGMAIINEMLMGIHFVPLIYKRLLTPGPIQKSLPVLPIVKEIDNDPVDMTDIALLDPDLRMQMQSLLSNQAIESLDLNMCLDADLGNGKMSFDLVKDGHQHRVTKSNVNQYVRQYVKWHTDTKVELQMRALCLGLWEVVPLRYLHAFTAQEFALLLAGQPIIDINDWMQHTVYEGIYNDTHPVILNFWRCIQQFEPEKQSKILVFVTGSPRVPKHGFQDLHNGKFTITSKPFISSIIPSPNSLPVARTCSNLLWIPVIHDYGTLCERLERIIQPDSLSFGFD